MNHNLIKALLIIEKYNPKFSTHCEHDVMSICGVEPDEVSEEDKVLLDEYGFFIGDECGETAFESFQWGSC
jgi:hypothetical protein